MTEEGWLPAPDVGSLIAIYSQSISARRARLFGVHFCTPLFEVLPVPEVRDGIRVAEQYADGLATDDQRAEARDRAQNAIPDFWGYRGELPFGVLHSILSAVSDLNHPEIILYLSEVIRDARRGLDYSNSLFKRERDRTELERSLIKEMFLPLFRPVTLDPRWRSPTVLELARTIYEKRTFESLPILVDALMDAGCDNEEILNHCRSEGPHVRGCWVVDLLLGKE